MNTDCFTIETVTNDKEAQTKIGMVAMTAASQQGYVEISPGCILYDNKTLIEHQKKLPDNDTGKTNDYTDAPFWMVLQPEGTVSPVCEPLDILEFMDSEPVRKTV